jgi:N-acyl-L-homoserine lactone synthetase
MIRIIENDPRVISEIIRFRTETYLKSGRDRNRAALWSSDDYDQAATHFVMYNEHQRIIGSVRIIMGDSWTLERYFTFCYDKKNGVEFGRLAISQRSFNDHRVLFELIKTACKYCAKRGKTHFYGFVIARFKRALQRLGVPFEVLSPELSPYGEASYLIKFSLDEMISF